MKLHTLVSHDIVNDKDTPVPQYHHVRVYLSKHVCDFIDIRVSKHEKDAIEISCGNGCLAVLPRVSNVVEVKRVKP